MTCNVTIGESHFRVKQIVFLGGIKKPWPNGFSANDKQKLWSVSKRRENLPQVGGRGCRTDEQWQRTRQRRTPRPPVDAIPSPWRQVGNPRRDFRRRIIGCLPPRVSLKEESGRPTTSRSPSIEFPARPVTRELLKVRRKA